MKRVIAFLLLAVMLSVSLSACAKADPEDYGSIIPLYLADPQRDLNPTEMIYDKDFVKSSSLLFEPLTQVTNSGEIVPVLISDWEERYNEERNEYYLTIDLVSTKWNDGRVFTADHVIYAWKYVLSPENASPAASLLYDIKNAKDVKAGTLTIDDLGVAAVDTDTLEVQFEKPIDPELFLEAVSSPSLVPLRDDVVQGKETVWASSPDDIATNGQFTIRVMDPQGEYRLDFSKYYKLVNDEDLGYPKKGYNQFVKPYRLVSDFTLSKEEAVQAFEEEKIYYVGAFTAETYAANEKEIESSETLSSFTYYFDCENATLKDAKVRRALSLALDREKVASIIGLGAQAAEGFVSDVASGSTMKKSYRSETGAIYSKSADVEAAKALLAEAGVKNGSFTITYRSDREYDVKVAEYAKSVWETLGFSVSLKGLKVNAYETALYAGDFDVISLDYMALSTNPYAALAPFAPAYSGNVVSVDAQSSGITPHVTGYSSDAYSALLDEVLELTTRKERAKKLQEIEKLLAEDCPAIALSFYSNNYLASSELKGLETSPYGYTIFTNAELKNYAEKNAAYEESLKQK